MKLAIIIYDSRSGSTLLSSLLNQIEGIVVAQETSYLRFILEYRENSIRDKQALKRMVDYLYTEQQFRELNLEKQQLLNQFEYSRYPITKTVFFQTITRTFFSTFVDLNDDFTYVLKMPVAHYFIEYLEQIIPNLSVIHIVRDGRAVFSSKRSSTSLDRKIFEKNLIVAALGWKRKLKRVERIKTINILNVSYENLVNDEQDVLDKIVDFLSIPVQLRGKTKSSEDYSKRIGKGQKSFHQNIGKPLQKRNIDKWKKNLNKGEILLYEYISYKELKRYKYSIQELEKATFFEKIIGFLFAIFYCLQFFTGRFKNLIRRIRMNQLGPLIRRKLIERQIIQPKI